MKILVFSDSHGKIENCLQVLEKLQTVVDMVFHLGDYDTDALQLAKHFPHIPIHFVKGNNDFSDTPGHKLVMAGGMAFLLTHGHKQRVHWNLQTIAYWAEEKGVDAVLFGHTHIPVNDGRGRVYLFNPGSISLPRDSAMPTFGILTVERGRLEGAIMEFSRDGTFFRR